MSLEILRIGHPVLRAVARQVTRDELLSERVQGLIDAMIETMHEARGAGLAAPQIGEGLRICVAKVSANERYPALPELPLRVWVNPEIEVVAPTPEVLMYEGCLSVPDLRGQVRRPAVIRVRSWDRQGRDQTDDFNGPLAAVAAHECDHLDGVLFVDRADPRTLCTLEEYARYVPPEERIQLIGP